MVKTLVVKRDGTLLSRAADGRNTPPLRLVPGVIRNLYRLKHQCGFRLMLACGAEPHDQQELLQLLAGEGVVFDEVLSAPGFARCLDGLERTGGEVYVLSDDADDLENAGAAGLVPLLFAAEEPSAGMLHGSDWDGVFRQLSRIGRSARVVRRTGETDIEVELFVDGTGRAAVSTGIGFFDHMLEQLARHSGCDITLRAKGDLHVDKHHTIEDSAIALGEALRQALGDKRGVQRYGFVLPMDDSLAQAAIDFSGRPWIEWQAEFTREKIGEMPTEMFFHFFKSFSDAAQCTLHVKADGRNEHHKIEAIFKAVAQSMRGALRREGEAAEVPSTKGTL